jgi:hypothetical protein
MLRPPSAGCGATRAPILELRVPAALMITLAARIIGDPEVDSPMAVVLTAGSVIGHGKLRPRRREGYVLLGRVNRCF